MDEVPEGEAPIPSDTIFEEGRVVLAFHGNLLYEARILNVTFVDTSRDEVQEYEVHYQGWKKSWREIVARNMVFEHNDDNLRVAHRLLNGAKMRQQALHPTPATEKEKSVEKTLPPSLQVQTLFQIPPALQRQLVDDWEFITKERRLVTLPRTITVDNILMRWLTHKRLPIDKFTKEVTESLHTYFNASLSKLLLYRFERRQYVDTFHKCEPPAPLASAVYGAEHLLRLLHKLPYLFESTAVGQEKIASISEKVNELLKYMQKNGRIFFLHEYEAASQAYVDNCDPGEHSNEE